MSACSMQHERDTAACREDHLEVEAGSIHFDASAPVPARAFAGAPLVSRSQ